MIEQVASQRRRRWLTIFVSLLSLPILLLGCACGGLFAAGLISPGLAYAVAPPIYPNSHLTHEVSGGGSGGTWKMTYYETADDIAIVLAHMERYRPGFTEADVAAIQGSKSPVPGYENRMCNEGWLARSVQNVLADNPFPFTHCVVVYLYRARPTNTGTIIVYWALWPSG